MTFEWHRMHKHEEQIENDVFDRVQQQILEHYGIEELSVYGAPRWVAHSTRLGCEWIEDLAHSTDSIQHARSRTDGTGWQLERP